MQKPPKEDLYADRYVMFTLQMAFFNEDFTGATFAMKVRDKPDEGGLPAISLATTTSTTTDGIRLIYAGTDTVANHIAAGRVSEAQALKAGYTTTDTVALSVIGFLITATTMALTDYPAYEIGDIRELAYDFLITLPSGITEKYFWGDFNVRGTVTY